MINPTITTEIYIYMTLWITVTKIFIISNAEIALNLYELLDHI